MSERNGEPGYGNSREGGENTVMVIYPFDDGSGKSHYPFFPKLFELLSVVAGYFCLVWGVGAFAILKWRWKWIGAVAFVFGALCLAHGFNALVG